MDPVQFDVTGALSLAQIFSSQPTTVTRQVQSKITPFLTKTKSSAVGPPATPLAPRLSNRPKTVRSILLQHKPVQQVNPIMQYSKPFPPTRLSHSWGHTLEEIDTSKVFRVFLQNPNGLSLSTTNVSLQQDLYGASILSFPETNTNRDNPSQPAALHHLLKQTWSSSAFQTSKSSETFLSHRQPGSSPPLSVGIGLQEFSIKEVTLTV
jgi:hypothetical protein